MKKYPCIVALHRAIGTDAAAATASAFWSLPQKHQRHQHHQPCKGAAPQFAVDPADEPQETAEPALGKRKRPGAMNGSYVRVPLEGEDVDVDDEEEEVGGADEDEQGAMADGDEDGDLPADASPTMREAIVTEGRVYLSEGIWDWQAALEQAAFEEGYAAHRAQAIVDSGEQREEDGANVGQATNMTGDVEPEAYQAGLDAMGACWEANRDWYGVYAWYGWDQEGQKVERPRKMMRIDPYAPLATVVAEEGREGYDGTQREAVGCVGDAGGAVAEDVIGVALDAEAVVTEDSRNSSVNGVAAADGGMEEGEMEEGEMADDVVVKDVGPADHMALEPATAILGKSFNLNELLEDVAQIADEELDALYGGENGRVEHETYAFGMEVEKDVVYDESELTSEEIVIQRWSVNWRKQREVEVKREREAAEQREKEAASRAQKEADGLLFRQTLEYKQAAYPALYGDAANRIIKLETALTEAFEASGGFGEVAGTQPLLGASRRRDNLGKLAIRNGTKTNSPATVAAKPSGRVLWPVLPIRL
ncbi:hypothetical protein HK101_006877 [Irineochytrium annulatum]|nr:hypothetical protein HK101_006877 [Irineochytrium annulatum]